jgi:hypothetical protein
VSFTRRRSSVASGSPNRPYHATFPSSSARAWSPLKRGEVRSTTRSIPPGSRPWRRRSRNEARERERAFSNVRDARRIAPRNGRGYPCSLLTSSRGVRQATTLRTDYARLGGQKSGTPDESPAGAFCVGAPKLDALGDVSRSPGKTTPYSPVRRSPKRLPDAFGTHASSFPLPKLAPRSRASR